MLHRKEFESNTLGIANDFANGCMSPGYFTLDRFLAALIATTEELRDRPLWVTIRSVTIAPVMLCLFLIFLPLTLFGFFISRILQTYFRNNYVYSEHLSNILKDGDFLKSGEFSIGTANVCLLPEFLSRVNNLSNLYSRAQKMGERIASHQLDLQRRNYHSYANGGVCHQQMESNGYTNGNASMYGAGDITKTRHNQCKLNHNQVNQNQHNEVNHNRHNQHNHYESNQVDFDHTVLTAFPQLDILCVQETWNKAAARTFARELHKYFPYIIYDAYVHGWTINKFSGTSGLMIASRHPIIDARFECFKSSVSQDVLSSKGLLMIKVDLGLKPGTNKRAVGYASTTHMQAYQNQLQESDSDTVHHQQLNDVTSWTRCFRDNTFDPKSEVIAFDVLTGDFNLDNMSPVDKEDYEHQLFDEYKDVVRVRPGEDHLWSKGTEMRHIPLYDAQVATAAGLKEALDDPYMLQHYVLDADVESATLDMCTWMPQRDASGQPILSKVGGRRRIDYLLYRAEDNVKVTSYNFVTQLARLTDHIPVSFTLATDI